jgi:hypothetical protein
MTYTRAAVERATKAPQGVLAGIEWAAIAVAGGLRRFARTTRVHVPYFIHLDGSRHAWLALRPTMPQTMLAIVDDCQREPHIPHLCELNTSRPRNHSEASTDWRGRP